jgi:hypothetical protein
MSNAGRVIVNVGHHDHQLSESILGKFIVKGRGEPHAEERPYGKLVMDEKYFEPQDRGWGDPSPTTPDGRYTREQDGAEFAGFDVKSWYDSLGRFSDGRQRKLGVFLAKGEEPTEEELGEATKYYLEELNIEFGIAHAAWNANHATRNINDHARLAVKVLGKDVPWCQGVEINRNLPCPNCGEFIPSTMAIHRRMRDGTECGFILDAEKAKRLVGGLPTDAAKRRAQADKLFEAPTG